MSNNWSRKLRIYRQRYPHVHCYTRSPCENLKHCTWQHRTLPIVANNKHSRCSWPGCIQASLNGGGAAFCPAVKPSKPWRLTHAPGSTLEVNLSTGLEQPLGTTSGFPIATASNHQIPESSADSECSQPCGDTQSRSLRKRPNKAVPASHSTILDRWST